MHVRAGSDDWGCHVFMVPSRLQVRHLTYFVFIALQQYIFVRQRASRLVHQPEIHNRKVGARLVQAGYVDNGVVHLSCKSVRVYSMTSEAFAIRPCLENPVPVALPSSPVGVRWHHLVGQTRRRLGLCAGEGFVPTEIGRA